MTLKGEQPRPGHERPDSLTEAEESRMRSKITALPEPGPVSGEDAVYKMRHEEGETFARFALAYPDEVATSATLLHGASNAIDKEFDGRPDADSVSRLLRRTLDFSHYSIYSTRYALIHALRRSHPRQAAEAIVDFIQILGASSGSGVSEISNKELINEAESAVAWLMRKSELRDDDEARTAVASQQERLRQIADLWEKEWRIRIVRRLHDRAAQEAQDGEPTGEDSHMLRFGRMREREVEMIPHGVTLGIEIEISEDAALSAARARGVLRDTDADRAEAVVSSRYRAISQDAGVPEGADKFWEFANRPVQYFMTLSREVQALEQLGLVPPVGREDDGHALHLTIGGINLAGTDRSSREAYVLARGLEASGHATTAFRLEEPRNDYFGAWALSAAKTGGVAMRTRSDRKLEGDTPYAIEIRTLQYRNLGDLHRTLRDAFYLGSACRAYQEVQRDSELLPGESEAQRAELARAWSDFSLALRRTFREYGMEDPADPWKAPYAAGEGDFGPLIRLLGEYEGDREKDEEGNSEGSQLVAEVDALIREARAKIVRVMLPESFGKHADRE